MDWDDLRFFLAIYRAGSLAAAARALGVTHVTVGRRLATLEDRVGRLFDRGSDRYALTPLGERIVDAVETMELGAEDAGRVLAAAERGETAVRLAIPPAFVEPVLDGLEGFRRAHPEIVLDVLAERQPVSMRRRQADLALRVWHRGDVPGDADTLTRRVGTLPWSFHATAELLDRRGISAPVDSLSSLPLVAFDGHLSFVPGAHWLEQHPPGHTALITSDLSTVVAAVGRGIGVGAIPDLLGRRAGLVSITPTVERFDVWIAMHPRHRDQPALAALRDALVAAVDCWC